LKKPHSRLSVTEICESKQLEIPFVATCVPLVTGDWHGSDIDKVCATASIILLEVEAETSNKEHRKAEVALKVELTFTLRRRGKKPIICTELLCFEREVEVHFPPGAQICASARATPGKCAVCVDPKKRPSLIITCPATLCLELTVSVTKEICVPVVGPCPFPYFPKCDPTCPPCKDHSGHSGGLSDSLSHSESDDDGSGWGSGVDCDDE